jgi:hypothetical protein
VSSPRDSLTGSLLVQVWSEELKLGWESQQQVLWEMWTLL